MAQIRFGVGPHLRGEDHTRSMMLDVLVALAPSYVWGVYAFGFRVLSHLVLGLLFAFLTEWAVLKIRKGKGGRITDCSALVTGAVLTGLLPVGVPLWVAPLGVLIAVAVFKHLFGGLGKNLFNPALASLFVLYWLLPSAVSVFCAPFEHPSPFALSLWEKMTCYPDAASALSDQAPLTLSQLLTGSVAGGMASVSVLLLLAGGIYLLVRGVISFQIPTAFLLTVAILTVAFPQGDVQNRWSFAATQLFSGSLFFAAFFVATDPVTSPMTRWGKLIYGALLGGATVLFRYFTSATDGALAAVLVLSVSSRFLDFLFRPRIYGQKRDFALSFSRIPKMFTKFLPKKEK